MERDFLGLNLQDSTVFVKEEAVEGFKDSGAPLPFSNKVSSLPAFMTFKAVQDEKMPKLVSDHLTSRFMVMPSADVFDTKHQSGEVQSAHPMHLTRDAKTLPISMSKPLQKTHFTGIGQNFAGTNPKQHFVGGVPVSASRSLLPSSFVSGMTEPWFSPKASGSPAQLTIFYGGTVNVFDDITPEKAQAIMFLAGNGCASPNISPTRLPAQSPASKFSPGDAGFVNQTIHPQPSSALSSPISVSSHPVCQSGGGSANSDERKAPKTTGISTNILRKVKSLNMVSSLGHVAGATMIPSAVPQARKASLARFLEKRKERVMNSAPYSFNKKSAGYANPDSINASPSATSIAGSSSPSTTTSNQMP